MAESILVDPAGALSLLALAMSDAAHDQRTRTEHAQVSTLLRLLDAGEDTDAYLDHYDTARAAWRTAERTKRAHMKERAAA